MSLYGALFSGISGMNAQSSAMGVISDNIANSNTVGYKGTMTQFSTMVTQQISQSSYSPGGVQSRPQAGIDVQGLVQSTNSTTDIAMSGRGFFVVNEVANPGVTGDQFGYTRAGSFKVDQEGYLQNTSGWYMQGWPLATWDGTMQASTLQIGNNTYMKSYKDPAGEQIYINDNVTSSVHLQPLNLNEIGGIAEQTRNIRMGANLPATARIGETITQPIRIYDSLGGESPMQILYTKNAQNRWQMETFPPLGTRSLSLKDSDGGRYSSMGRLDFESLPQAYQPDNGVPIGDPAHIPMRGQVTMEYGGHQYVFRTGTALYDAAGAQLFADAAGTIPAVGTDGMNPETQFFNAAGVLTDVAFYDDDGITLMNNADIDGVFFTDSTTTGLSLTDFTTNIANDMDVSFNARYNSIGIGGTPAVGDVLSLTINGETPPLAWTMPASVTTQAGAASFLNGSETFLAAGLNATVIDGRLSISSDESKTITVHANSTGAFDDNTAAAGNWTRYDATGAAVAADSIVTSGIQYVQKMQDSDGSGTSGLVFRQTSNDPAAGSIEIGGLDSMVKPNGSPATMQSQDPEDSDGFIVGNLTHAPAAGDSANDAIIFNEDGTPKTINVSAIEIDWANGSEDMNGLNEIDFFLGNLNVRDGLTQSGDQYVMNYWQQDGTRFGNFSGVSIGTDGIVTALFDNGVIRPVFQIPVATFVNYNGMQAISGNVYLSTDHSGEPTLRGASTAGAGAMAAASLEASTVDIATEFTNMIITQRAYSAASKTVITTDEMLTELINIKR